MWHARENTESYLFKLIGLDAFEHETPKIWHAVEGLRGALERVLDRRLLWRRLLNRDEQKTVRDWLATANKAALKLMNARDVVNSAYDTARIHVENVHQAVESCCQTWRGTYREIRFKGVTGNYSAGVSIQPQSLEKILAILVNNASEHGGGRIESPIDVEIDVSEINVQVGKDEVEPRVLISFVDTGKGIPATIAPFVFSSRVSTSSGDGHGSGLSTARYLAKAYGGTVELLENTTGRVVFGVLLDPLGKISQDSGIGTHTAL
jgi:signal transduction histidine kinase